MRAAPRPLTPKLLDTFARDFRSRPANRIAMNASTRAKIDEIAMNREAFSKYAWQFSKEFDVGGVTNQRRAGICWMFAGLNWMRKFTMKKANLEEFEYSENFLVFYDKLEKCNRFLESILEVRDRPTDDRLVRYLLDDPVPDAGEWHMLADIIDKYGLVPKSAMEDTQSLRDSSLMNEILQYKLREAAARIFELTRKKAKLDRILEVRHETLATVHRILTILLGEPPKKIDFLARDKKKKFKARRGLTPKQFYSEFVGLNLKDYVWMMSSPLPDTEVGRCYYFDYFYNTVGGRKGVFLNVEFDALKRTALTVMKSGESVLFTCDVTQDTHRTEGILDPDLYDYPLLFDTEFTMDRRSRLEFRQSKLTHSMVFVGLDTVRNKPRQWKVENSWGEDNGKKGLFLMTDSWFDEYVYAILVHKKRLNRAQEKALRAAPTALPAWHPLA